MADNTFQPEMIFPGNAQEAVKKSKRIILRLNRLALDDAPKRIGVLPILG